MYVHRVYAGAQRDQKKVLDLELGMVVSHCVYVGNQTWVLLTAEPPLQLHVSHFLLFSHLLTEDACTPQTSALALLFIFSSAHFLWSHSFAMFGALLSLYTQLAVGVSRHTSVWVFKGDRGLEAPRPASDSVPYLSSWQAALPSGIAQVEFSICPNVSFALYICVPSPVGSVLKSSHLYNQYPGLPVFLSMPTSLHPVTEL